jgi:hypothetical protein
MATPCDHKWIINWPLTTSLVWSFSAKTNVFLADSSPSPAALAISANLFANNLGGSLGPYLSLFNYASSNSGVMSRPSYRRA